MLLKPLEGTGLWQVAVVQIGRLLAMNLRTHRKILVVDGVLGFTGGFNIRVGHCLLKSPAHPVQDLHFRVEGPIVTQMQEAARDGGGYLRAAAVIHQFGSQLSAGKIQE